MLKKLLKIFTMVLKYPRSLNYVINNDMVWEKKLEKKQGNLIGFPMIELKEIDKSFSETLKSFSFLGGGSLPTDIALLKCVCRKFENCSYFEIGTWRGESVLNISEIAEECYTLNLSREEIIKLYKNELYADLHGFFSKGKSNIHHLTGNSLNYDFAGLNKKFDVIFIDGDHQYDNVKNDTEKVFKNLIHDESIIIWHDYAYNPEKLRPEVMLAILAGTPTKYHKYLYFVANTMCAIFYRNPVKTKLFNP